MKLAYNNEEFLAGFEEKQVPAREFIFISFKVRCLYVKKIEIEHKKLMSYALIYRMIEMGFYSQKLSFKLR